MSDQAVGIGKAPSSRRRQPSRLEDHLRVEVVDAGHMAWPAVRLQMDRAGGADRLRVVTPDGHLSARHAVVAAFLNGRVVGHACFTIEPARTPSGTTVVARMDSQAVDTAFAGTAVEAVLMTVAESRARTMGCRGFTGMVVADTSRWAA